MGSIKKIITTTWLGRLWQKSRVLCIAVIIFFCGTLGANFIQLETTPFFVWDMYKNPVRDTSDYDLYLIQYNKTAILNFDKTWKEPQKIYLTSPLFYYLQYKAQHDTESSAKYMAGYWAIKHPSFKWVLPYLNNSNAQFATFPGWYKKYLSAILDKEIHEVTIIKKHIRFMNDFSVKEIGSDSINIIP